MSEATAQPNAASGPIIFEYTEKAVDGVSKVTDFILTPIAASEAFRKYNWLVGSPMMNQAGDLRGMVINARMRTIYTVSGKVSDRVAVVGALLEVGKEMTRIKAVYGSNEDGLEKTSRILLLTSAAVLRSVTSVVPTAIHLGAISIGGYAQLYSAATGSPSGDALSGELEQFADRVEMIHRKQWDGETWYNFINATLR